MSADDYAIGVDDDGLPEVVLLQAPSHSIDGIIVDARIASNIRFRLRINCVWTIMHGTS